MDEDKYCSIEDIKAYLKLPEGTLEEALKVMIKEGTVETKDIVIEGKLTTYYRMRKMGIQ